MSELKSAQTNRQKLNYVLVFVIWNFFVLVAAKNLF